MSSPHVNDVAIAEAIKQVYKHFSLENAIVVIKSPDSGHLIFESIGSMPMQLGLVEIHRELLKRGL